MSNTSGDELDAMSLPSTSPSDMAPKFEGSTTKKRIQYCTFCKNHKKEEPKKGHTCPYKDCDCVLCELLRKAQITMRHQQRVWRHQKFKLQPSNDKSENLTNILNEKGQMCDKCRNHNKLKLKKNHPCPFDNCECQYCSLTYKRRELMKYLQRVRRSNLTSDINSEDNQIYANEQVELSSETDHERSISGASDSDEGKLVCHQPSECLEKEDQLNHNNENTGRYSSEAASAISTYSSGQGQESEVEDMALSSATSTPLPVIPSPPPLIPLSIMHRNDTSVEKTSNSTHSDTGSDLSYRETDQRNEGLHPPTCSLYPREETILQASTRILSRLGRLPPKCYEQKIHMSAWNELLDVHRPPEKLSKYPEQDLYRRQYAWPPSASSVIYSNSYYNASNCRPETHFVPERHYPTNFSVPEINNPYPELRFRPQNMSNRMFLTPFVPTEQIHPHEIGSRELLYYEQNRLD